MLTISFQPEYIAAISGLHITNSLLTSFLVTIILVTATLLLGRVERADNLMWRATRYVLFQMLRLTEMVVGDRKRALAVLPLIATFFIFIVTANLLELVPGFLGSFYVDLPAGRAPLLRSPDSDLNTTVALALIAVGATQFFSLRHLGIRDFFRRFFDLRSPVRFFLGFFEVISESVKVLSFSFRLFGNVFAGEVLLLVVAFLVPYFVPVPFMILEIFVGVIQAFIFSMLTLSFIRTASVPSDAA